MKKFTLILISILSISLLAVAQIKFVVYLNDDKPVELLAENVEKITFGTSQSEGETPDESVVLGEKLYFFNNPGWENVYVYIWSDGTDEQYSAWPGVLANKEDNFIEGFDVYSFDMKGKEKYDKIIFNNGSIGKGDQTDDLNVDYETPYYMQDNWYMSIDDMPHKGHAYVDLGLPSGLLWAACNVGANSPEDYGDYFAWGETEPKSTYNLSTYKWCRGSSSIMTKYDYKTVLELSDDAANANWGGDWRMPTKEEQDELRTECFWTWTTKNGVEGYNVVSKTNGNSIFLPAASCRIDFYLSPYGYYGYYWSSSLITINSNDAHYLYLNPDYVYGSDNSRYHGRSVRPVMSK